MQANINYNENLPLQFWFCRNSGSIFPLYTKTMLIIADGIMDHLITPEYILLKKNDWVLANVYTECYNAYKYDEIDNTLTLISFVIPSINLQD